MAAAVYVTACLMIYVLVGLIVAGVMGSKGEKEFIGDVLLWPVLALAAALNTGNRTAKFLGKTVYRVSRRFYGED